MKEKVAVATVQGKTYFLLVNALREQGIGFMSLIPGQPIPSKAKLVLTTPEEKPKINYDKVLLFTGENELDSLIVEVKKRLLGRENCDRIIIGIDPGEAIGLAFVADGKVIEEDNCYSSRQLITSILKVLKTVNFANTKVTVKIGNGVPIYKDLLWDLDENMPPKVQLEIVDEAGTNKSLRVHSRKIRHISSAIRIAGRTGRIVGRRRTIATNGAA